MAGMFPLCWNLLFLLGSTQFSFVFLDSEQLEVNLAQSPPSIHGERVPSPCPVTIRDRLMYFYGLGE